MHNAIAALDCADNRIVVAFSGGLDSTALLHACAQFPSLKNRVRALHVHHGLSPNADAWAEHCQRICAELQIPLMIQRVSVVVDGNGTEEAARQARYSAFRQHTYSGDLLLLAHHRDDQIETFFMRAVRGSGLAGLSAMPAQRQLQEGVSLMRPWLAFSRAELEHYAQAHGLQWIEDESNNDERYERNWWRKRLLPTLFARFGAKRDALAGTIEQLGRDQAMLNTLLEPLVAEVCVPCTWPNSAAWSCTITCLQHYPESYWPYLLRGWLQRCELPAPSQEWLQTCINEVIQAQADAQPELMLDGWQLNRHQGQLLFFKTVLPAVDPIPLDLLTALPSGSALPLAWAGGTITRQNSLYGLAAGHYQMVPASRVRQHSLQARGRPHKTVKALLQEAGIPVALRAQWPALLQEDRLCALVGIAESEQASDENGVSLLWLK